MEKFHKAIIFCKTELKGYYRFGDEFQIYPANFEGMPKSSLQEHHPIVLEYVVHENEEINYNSEDFDEELKDLRTLAASTLSKQDKIISLLTLCTNHFFFRYYELTGRWGMPILKENAGKDANTWSSKWNLPFFHWPEYPEQFKIIKFKNFSSDELEVKRVKHYDYFFKDPNFDYHIDSEITITNLIDDALSAYFEIEDTENLKVIDSAISFVYSAFEMKQFRKTMSVIAAFTAIETLVNFEFRDLKPEKCEVCGQLKYQVMKKYRDFLFKYIGENDSNKKKFNAFYKLRSSIVHTGEKLKTENLFSGLSTDEKDKEFLTHMEILQLSKLSILHWLILNKKTKEN